jgi:L,D-transpeptidase catalytic domain
MRSATFLPASLIAAALVLSFAAPARANILVTIDKNTQRMSVSVDGTQRYDWPVSTGRHGYDTPNGTFRPFRMEVSHFSKAFDDAPMPHSIFFTKVGHAIHGSLDTGHLGSAASHGCVRLSPANADTLYALVKEEGMGDTTVVIAGHTPAGASPDVARRRAPVEESAEAPMQVAPRYNERPAPYYAEQQQPYYGQPQPYYRQPQYYYVQQQPYYEQQQLYYAQPAYRQPQYYVLRPYNPY